jgi:DNA topoisomerase-1
VQSVALRIVCDREREIKSFKAEEYWSITANLEGSLPPAFQAKLFKIGQDKAEVHNKQEADKILGDLTGAKYILGDIAKKERKRNPSAPFITSTLQQEASRKLSFSPKKTMMLAQKLYEGMELGQQGTVGLITYMRTDSTRMADEAVQGVREFIGSRYGKEFVPEAPNVYRSKKSAQEAHEAIRPTDVTLEPQAIKEFLEKDVFNLYELIWARFVSCQMVPAVMDTTQFDIPVGKYLFRANGSVIKFPGFLKVYEESYDEPAQTTPDRDAASENARDTDRLLPPLKSGETLKLAQLLPEQHFTQPPPRFSEASLVKALEEQGIGRPSTYASIITVIKDREYIKNEERKLFPTELGVLVSDLLVEHFPDIMSAEFTSNMEDKLDLVEEGKAEWVATLQAFYTPFQADLEKAETKMQSIKGQVEETDQVCDKCAKPMVIKWGRFGKFMACTGYPECKSTREIGGGPGGKTAETEAVDGVCDKCGGALLIRMGRFGKFIACSKYPECKFTRPITLGIPCPLTPTGCKGSVLSRRTKKGRTFYGCSEYPKCNFTSWDKPVAEACPSCKAPYLVEKWKKNGGRSLECKAEGCSYKRAEEEKEAAGV